MGEAIARGVSQGTSNFMAMRQREEERRRREEERRRQDEDRRHREASERLRQALALAQHGGGFGTAPTTTGLRVDPNIDTTPVVGRGRPGLLSGITPVEQTAPGYVQIIDPTDDHPGAYIRDPRAVAEEDTGRQQAVAEEERRRRIEDALVSNAINAGVAPGAYYREDGTLDHRALGDAVAAAMARLRQSPQQQAWQVRDAREQMIDHYASQLYTRFTQTGRPLQPTDRTAAHYVALGMLRNDGIPDHFVPEVLNRMFSVYARGRGPEDSPDMGRVVSDALNRFGEYLRTPAGSVHRADGNISAAAQAWLRSGGDIEIRALAAQYGIDYNTLRDIFLREIGAGGERGPRTR